MHDKPRRRRRERRRRKTSAFIKILVALTIVCGALVAVGVYVIRSIGPVDIDPPVAAGCSVSGDGGRDALEPEQAASAATVSGVAFARDLPEEAVVVAFATVWQETKFFNIDYGDRDSVGLFQQRPSQEWGEPEQIMDPVYASGKFYEHLEKVDGYAEMPVYEAAQQVQRSADGFAYDQHEKRSRQMAAAFTGGSAGAVTCWPARPAGGEGSPSPSARPAADPDDVQAALEEMERVFGASPTAIPASGEQPRTGDLGWAMALWAVSHSEEYGLSSVTYQDQRWTAQNGKDGWSTVPDAAPDGEVVLG
ncbi:hypothetical protein [Nocardiopsis composta]|uniref:hypothetical protein n=1 Tax=Nocardiopsis composta TaxID=157465 RepID=UPI0035E411DF